MAKRLIKVKKDCHRGGYLFNQRHLKLVDK